MKRTMKIEFSKFAIFLSEEEAKIIRTAVKLHRIDLANRLDQFLGDDPDTEAHLRKVKALSVRLEEELG